MGPLDVGEATLFLLGTMKQTNTEEGALASSLSFQAQGTTLELAPEFNWMLGRRRWLVRRYCVVVSSS